MIHDSLAFGIIALVYTDGNSKIWENFPNFPKSFTQVVFAFFEKEFMCVMGDYISRWLVLIPVLLLWGFIGKQLYFFYSVYCSHNIFYTASLFASCPFSFLLFCDFSKVHFKFKFDGVTETQQPKTPTVSICFTLKPFQQFRGHFPFPLLQRFYCETSAGSVLNSKITSRKLQLSSVN